MFTGHTKKVYADDSSVKVTIIFTKVESIIWNLEYVIVMMDSGKRWHFGGKEMDEFRESFTAWASVYIPQVEDVNG